MRRLLAGRHQGVKTGLRTILRSGIGRGVAYSLIVFLFCFLTFSALLPYLSNALIFHIPGPSDTFDCDDGALLMYNRLSDLGIKATPIVGDLEATGEEYQDITHVWLLAEIYGVKVPFDWGAPHIDKQHYEGYPITYDQLLELVRQDEV